MWGVHVVGSVMMLVHTSTVVFLHLGLQSVIFFVVKESYIHFFHCERTVSRSVCLITEMQINCFSRASHVIYIMKALLI